MILLYLSWGIFLRLSGQALLFGLLGKSLIWWIWELAKNSTKEGLDLAVITIFSMSFRSLVSRQLDGIFRLRALKWKKPRLTKPRAKKVLRSVPNEPREDLFQRPICFRIGI